MQTALSYRWCNLDIQCATDYLMYLDFSKNMLLLKNQQFSPNHYETLSKYGTHEDLTLMKFRNDWVKIVDFLIKAYFWLSPD